MLKPLIYMPAALGLSFILTACGSGSSDDDAASSSKTGVFVDSAVANIAYTTQTQSGFTNTHGEFEYEEGEMVTFSIGGIDLPAVTAAGQITPLDLADSLDLDDITVSNIARFLQSLDTDGDPSNGIIISDTAHDTAEAMEDIDFSATDFADNTDITNLLANSGSTTTSIISAADAKEHFASSLATTFTAYMINGKTFSVSSNDEEITFFELVFDADGTGTIEFEIEEGEERDINNIAWEVNGKTLTFKETDSYGDTWDWVFEATSASQTDSVINVDFDVSVTEYEGGTITEYTGLELTITYQFPT